MFVNCKKKKKKVRKHKEKNSNYTFNISMRMCAVVVAETARLADEGRDIS